MQTDLDPIELTTFRYLYGGRINTYADVLAAQAKEAAEDQARHEQFVKDAKDPSVRFDGGKFIQDCLIQEEEV